MSDITASTYSHSVPDLLEHNLLLGTMLLHASSLLLPYCEEAIRDVQKRMLQVRQLHLRQRRADGACHQPPRDRVIP